MDEVRKLNETYQCNEPEGPVCREKSNDEEFDPRSYCYSILAKGEKVCGRSAYRKFLRTYDNSENVCRPRTPCKLKRFFGPEPESKPTVDEDEKSTRKLGSQFKFVLDEGEASGTDTLGKKADKHRYITQDDRPPSGFEISEKEFKKIRKRPSTILELSEVDITKIGRESGEEEEDGKPIVSGEAIVQKGTSTDRKDGGIGSGGEKLEGEIDKIRVETDDKISGLVIDGEKPEERIDENRKERREKYGGLITDDEEIEGIGEEYGGLISDGEKPKGRIDNIREEAESSSEEFEEDIDEIGSAIHKKGGTTEQFVDVQEVIYEIDENGRVRRKTVGRKELTGTEEPVGKTDEIATIRRKKRKISKHKQVIAGEEPKGEIDKNGPPIRRRVSRQDEEHKEQTDINGKAKSRKTSKQLIADGGPIKEIDEHEEEIERNVSAQIIDDEEPKTEVDGNGEPIGKKVVKQIIDDEKLREDINQHVEAKRNKFREQIMDDKKPKKEVDEKEEPAGKKVSKQILEDEKPKEDINAYVEAIRKKASEQIINNEKPEKGVDENGEPISEQVIKQIIDYEKLEAETDKNEETLRRVDRKPIIDDEEIAKNAEVISINRGMRGPVIVENENSIIKKDKKPVIDEEKPEEVNDENRKAVRQMKSSDEEVVNGEKLAEGIDRKGKLISRKQRDRKPVINTERSKKTIDANGKLISRKPREKKPGVGTPEKSEKSIDANGNVEKRIETKSIVDNDIAEKKMVDHENVTQRDSKSSERGILGQTTELDVRNHENEEAKRHLLKFSDAEGKGSPMTAINETEIRIHTVEDEVPDFGEIISSPLPKNFASTRRTSAELITDQYARSAKRPSIEAWVESRAPFSDGLPTTVTGASAEPLDLAFPAVRIHGPIRIIPKGTDEPESSKPDKKSHIESVKSIKMKKPHENLEMDMFTPVLKRKSSEAHLIETEQLAVEEAAVVPEIVPVKIPLPLSDTHHTSSTSVKSEEVQHIADVEIDVLTFDQAAKARAQSRKHYMNYTDVCDCLPGFCVCGSQHYTFKPRDVGTESISSINERPFQAEYANEWNASAYNYEDISTNSSCICYHSWKDEEDKSVEITPASTVYNETVHISKKPGKKIVYTQPTFQKTVIIVKPEAVNIKDNILRSIRKAGLDIINERLVQLSPEQVSEVYGENYGSAYFPMFVKKMSSTPILVLEVAGNYAVDRWKYIIGQGDVMPSSWFYSESMKRRFGVHCDIFGTMNTLADLSTAKNEIRYFFPFDIIDPILIESEKIQDYCDKYIHPTLLRGLYKLLDEKPEDPVLRLAEWLLKNNPYQPYYLDSLVALAPT